MDFTSTSLLSFHEVNNNQKQSHVKKTFLILAMIFGVVAAQARQLPTPTSLFDNSHVEFKYYGFYGIVEYTHMFNFANESPQYLNPSTGTVVTFVDKYHLNGITAIAGWQWRKESAIGLGFSYFSDPQSSFSQIPVFIEFRSHFLRSRITPFTSVQVGYSIPFGSKNSIEEYTRIDEGGITFGITAGARFAITPKLGINLYAGYQMIHLNSVERGFNMVASTKMSELYDNLRFGIGVNF